MLRAAVLTYRMHRFEVLATVVALALMAASLIVVREHLSAIDAPSECFPYNGLPPASCDAVLHAFYRITGEVGLLLGPVAFMLPSAIGLVLGVPIVGREIEMRTTWLAWSLSGDRPRWLVQRLLPMFGLALLGLVIVGYLLTDVRTATNVGYGPDLYQLGSFGPTFVGRGIMALGIALLAGAITGRTLPGFIAAGALLVALVGFGQPFLRHTLEVHQAVWLEGDLQGNGPPLGLTYIDFAFRDDDGRFLYEDEADERVRQECPSCKGDARDVWLEENLKPVFLTVPHEALPVFEVIETATATGIGAAAALLTLVVVTRRRPA